MRNLVEYLNRRRFTVLFSGGKDSTATLLWVIDNIVHRDWNVVFIRVAENTHSLNEEYVVNLCDSLDILDRLVIASTNRSFFGDLEKWGIPLLGCYRWCYYHYKQKVVNWLARKRLVYRVQVSGVTRTSRARRNLRHIEYYRLDDAICVLPVLDWSREEILDYVKDHGVELNPCYKLVGHSGNCLFCPYHTKAAIYKTISFLRTFEPDLYHGLRRALLARRPRGRLGREILKRWLGALTQGSLRSYAEFETKPF